MLPSIIKNSFFLIAFITSLNSWSQTREYRADITNLISKIQKNDFSLELTEIESLDSLKIKGVFKKENEIQLIEEALLDPKTAEIIDYKIDQKQTGEMGHIQIKDQKVVITYKNKDLKEKAVTLGLPSQLVAPANFNQWLQRNFLILKEKKSIVIDFLVWDKLDTYSFKVSYLGEVELNGKKAHQFKMNINNRFVAAFVDPIFIWYNLPMTQIQQYQGRVAVKLGSGPDLKNMDALVKYYH